MVHVEERTVRQRKETIQSPSGFPEPERASKKVKPAAQNPQRASFASQAFGDSCFLVSCRLIRI